jgi:predicted ATPase
VLVIARDPGTMCRIHLALSCWVRGQRDIAIRHMEMAQSMAEAVSHPYSVGLAKYHAALLCLFHREVDLTRESAEDAWAFANDHGFPLLEAASAILRGWAWVQEDQTEAGIAEMQCGLKVFTDIGFKAFIPFYLMLLADAYACAGEIQEALLRIGESRALLEQTGEKLMTAELHRLEAELLLKQKACDASQTAEALLQKSLAIARSQQAKSWELRAATDLARLWNAQGKTQDGRAVLTACLASCTNDLGMAELLQARGLLGEIG